MLKLAGRLRAASAQLFENRKYSAEKSNDSQFKTIILKRKVDNWLCSFRFVICAPGGLAAPRVNRSSAAQLLHCPDLAFQTLGQRLAVRRFHATDIDRFADAQRHFARAEVDRMHRQDLAHADQAHR